MNDSISRQAAIDVARKCSVKEVTPAYMLIDKAEVMTELMMLPSAQPTQLNTPNTLEALDCISRKDAIDAAIEAADDWDGGCSKERDRFIRDALEELPSAQPDLGKYEYHYDHTDCIWYRPEARNRCPSTCAQYRDGWNDAMNYIFRDGKGYRPYRRDRRYKDVDID